MKSDSKSVLKSVPELKLVPYLAASVLMIVGMVSLLTFTVTQVPVNAPKCAADAKASAYASTEELLVSKCGRDWM